MELKSLILKNWNSNTSEPNPNGYRNTYSFKRCSQESMRSSQWSSGWLVMFRCMSCWQLGIIVRTLSRIWESLFPRCEAVNVFFYHIYSFGGREVNERWCDHIYFSVIEISCVCISVLKENESKGVIVLQLYNAWHLSDYKMLKHYANAFSSRHEKQFWLLSFHKWTGRGL